MIIFLDTSAILAALNRNDHFHLGAKQAWQELLSADNLLITSSYVLIEVNALLQNRFGMEAVRLFESDFRPILEIIWVDEPLHQRGLSALLAANRRQLSLVDCISFEIMRQRRIERVFTFDEHFEEQGFVVIPPFNHSPGV